MLEGERERSYNIIIIIAHLSIFQVQVRLSPLPHTLEEKEGLQDTPMVGGHVNIRLPINRDHPVWLGLQLPLTHRRPHTVLVLCYYSHALEFLSLLALFPYAGYVVIFSLQYEHVYVNVAVDHVCADC